MIGLRPSSPRIMPPCETSPAARGGDAEAAAVRSARRSLRRATAKFRQHGEMNVLPLPCSPRTALKTPPPALPRRSSSSKTSSKRSRLTANASSPCWGTVPQRSASMISVRRSGLTHSVLGKPSCAAIHPAGVPGQAVQRLGEPQTSFSVESITSAPRCVSIARPVPDPLPEPTLGRGASATRRGLCLG